MAALHVIPRLLAKLSFPPTSSAAVQPDGLLAWGGDLSAERLLMAYSKGIFPWYNPGEALLWWAPSQRMVLRVEALRVSASMRKLIKQIQRADLHANSIYEIRLDTAFTDVMRACATPRGGAHPGTWISEEIIQAYTNLHRLGYAHSVETWHQNQLVGGLYGISIGRMFYGESMFSHRTNASKLALIFTAHFLQQQGCPLIDCQQDTAHLASMGAQTIAREDFEQWLKVSTTQSPMRWPRGKLNPAIVCLSSAPRLC